MDDNNTNNQNPQREDVIDGQVVSSDTSKVETGEAIVLQNLESLINENLIRIDKLNEELKQQKEMLDSVLENDPTYQEHSKVAKEASRVKTATKNEILKRPDVAHVDAKVKGLRAEVKEIKESMSSYLQEFQRMSGLNQIDTQNGETMEIVYIAKLIKRPR